MFYITFYLFKSKTLRFTRSKKIIIIIIIGQYSSSIAAALCSLHHFSLQLTPSQQLPACSPSSSSVK